MAYMIFGQVRGEVDKFVNLDLQPWPTRDMADCRVEALMRISDGRFQIRRGACEVLRAGGGEVVFDSETERNVLT